MGSFKDPLTPVSAAQQWRDRQSMNLAAQQQLVALANSQRPANLAGVMNAYRPTPMSVARYMAEGAGVNILALLHAAPSILERDGIVLAVSHNTRTREIYSVTVEVRTKIPRVRRLEKTPPEGHNPPEETGETDGGESTATEAAGRD